MRKNASHIKKLKFNNTTNVVITKDDYYSITVVNYGEYQNQMGVINVTNILKEKFVSFRHIDGSTQITDKYIIFV